VATITASTLQTLLNVNTLAEATCEAIIDQAVDLINLHSRADLPNMTGTAGSKTLSVESRAKGAIMLVAAAVYSNLYVSSGSQSSTYTLGNMSLSQSAASSTGAVDTAVDKAARLLAEPEVDYG